MNLLFRSALVLAASLLGIQAAFAADSAREPLVVFAAASLTDSLQKVSDAYTKASGVPVKLSFAASSALAKQIESGAPADVFFSADQEWMDYLDQKQLIARTSRKDLLGNRLVLVAPRDSAVKLKLGPGAPLLAALGDRGRLASGDPDSVPAGKYAKAALTSLNIWSAVEPRLARAENVRVALMYVARGETPLGIVYETDVAAEPRVRIVDTFPESSHQAIHYPVAAVANARAEATSFLRFLNEPTARSIFAAAGFKVLSAATPPAAACSGFRFDLSRELRLFAGTPKKIESAANAQRVAEVQEGELYEVKLLPQANLRLPVPAGKITVAEGSFAGIIRVPSPRARTVRVTLNEAAWIDLVQDNRAIESARHTGAHDCPSVRKSVEFNVTPNEPLLIQLSGSTAPAVLLTVSGA